MVRNLHQASTGLTNKGKSYERTNGEGERVCNEDEPSLNMNMIMELRKLWKCSFDGKRSKDGNGGETKP